MPEDMPTAVSISKAKKRLEEKKQLLEPASPRSWRRGLTLHRRAMIAFMPPTTMAALKTAAAQYAPALIAHQISQRHPPAKIKPEAREAIWPLKASHCARRSVF